ncbi:uncharacterized protein [Maniola hyperantus]|uniref:uncharacterized protein n=2 Tax=Aphantopus hyperantus TaxID=2795564 RepID=UPI0037482FCC
MPNLHWNCCNETKCNEDYVCCAICNKAYHHACLLPTGQSTMNTELESDWKCPSCTSKRPKGNNENTPVRNDTKLLSEQNTAKRSNKRAAFSPPEQSCSTEQSDFREMVRDILKTEMSEMVTHITASIKSVLNSELKLLREEITDMKNSISFINDQYDDFIKEYRANEMMLKDLKENNNKLEATIENLHIRINDLEQRSRSNNLELQCIPERKNENLIAIIEQLGSVIGQDTTPDKILNVTRVAKVNRLSTRPRSIIVQFNSPLTRDGFLAAVIKHNKSNPTDKLNTSHIGIGAGGEKKPIYVVEHLSPENKALHAATRMKAKEKGYRYVWVRNGRILIRKDDSSDYKIVKNMDFLNKLS